MQHNDYDSLSYNLKFKRALKKALIVLIIAITVIAPALWCWGQSMERRQVLREAKNVVLNMELLGMEYYGFESSILDSARPSGMSVQAENEIRSFAGVDGEIYLISWNTKDNCVATMNYQKGRFLVQYRYGETDGSAVWYVYRNVRKYDNWE